MGKRRIPLATYRLQLNEGFRFKDARELAPYLDQLGISDIYSSPVFQARKGSRHGYDTTDSTVLNVELGTKAEFKALGQQLTDRGMGILLDIVPNHMAASPENPRWMDVLENGRASSYAAFFDIDWNPEHSSLRNRVLLPILATPYQQALESRDIRLKLKASGLALDYKGFELPLNVKSYRRIIAYRLSVLEGRLGADCAMLDTLRRLLDVLERIPNIDETCAEGAAERLREWLGVKRRFQTLLQESDEFRAFMGENIALLNSGKGDGGDLDLMHSLLQDQVYRLAFWRTGLKEMNYRRFFDISDLVGIRVEDSSVFETTHELILRLANEGRVSGLRIDHIDGLRDPVDYLHRLQFYLKAKAKQNRFPGFYIVVEKILAADEQLPGEWPVAGTTGYDFLNAVNALFVDAAGFQALQAAYSRFTRHSAAFDDVVYEKKKQVMKELLVAEVRALSAQLSKLARQSEDTRKLPRRALARALVEVTACLPVYRTYIRTLKLSSRDRGYIGHAVEDARRRALQIYSAALAFLTGVLLLDSPTVVEPGTRQARLAFVLRWQQFTGAVMAKGLEDTALYNHNALVSACEVGGGPALPRDPVESFHLHNIAKRAKWPHTLNATSTHDTKRGEDVRARINVLSETADEWVDRVVTWSRLNRPKKHKVDGRLVPDRPMEMLLYQTLIGAWPVFEQEVPKFKRRLKDYLVKAAREAKTHTSWLSPDPDYENALVSFAESMLDTSDRNDFLDEFLRFQRRIARYGALNSLAQVLLKITCPGVPDFYQGTELWDLNLVDPDNRRPVDFATRTRLLADLVRQEARGELSLARELASSWHDGRVKLYVTYRALTTRREHRDLFLNGEYIPLRARGSGQQHLFAFARRHEGAWALTIAPRLASRLVAEGDLPVAQRVWGDDALSLPDGAPSTWLNALTGEHVTSRRLAGELLLRDVFHSFPVALLISGGLQDGHRPLRAHPLH